MTTMFKKFATGTAALALMTTVFASGALAADTDVDAKIDGTESVEITALTAGNSFGAITLNGTTQTLKNDSLGSFAVTDARGTGAGWDISISANSFTNAEAPEGLQALSAGSLTLGAPTVSLADDNSSEISTIEKAVVSIDGSLVNTLQAVKNGGMGSYTISGMPMELELKPKEVYEGTYRSTITVELAAGPSAADTQ